MLRQVIVLIAMLASSTLAQESDDRRLPIPSSKDIPAASKGSVNGPSGPLNPHGLPPLGSTRILLSDPADAVRVSIAREDWRPFSVVGLFQNSGYSPGIFCAAGQRNLESRGGAAISDVPGEPSTSNAPSDRMEAFNRILASDAHFQKITGCRPSTDCEERYRDSYSNRSTRDPSCPHQTSVLNSIAGSGATADLVVALGDFQDGLPASKDAITSAFANAIGSGRMANAQALFEAGADINGRAAGGNSDIWLVSPLAAVFNNNHDRIGVRMRAEWLFARGGNFTNPGSAQALAWMSSAGDLPMVEFLLHHGASPNGNVSKVELDELAREDIQSAGGQVRTPFYTAIEEALANRDRRTPNAQIEADAERAKALSIAIRLYEAGGRFIAGTLQDNVRSGADIDVASILLAAAAREGRLEDLIGRWSENGFPRTSRNQAAGDQRFAAYLAAIRRCATIRPQVAKNHIQLCADNSI